GVLQDHAKGAPDDVAWQLARIDAVEADRAAVDLVEAHEQFDDGRLAGARRANDRDRLSRRNIEAEVLDERLLGLIAEGHAVERDPARRRRQRATADAVRKLLGRGQEFEEAPRGREYGLQEVGLRRDLGDRHGELAG